MHLKLNEDFIEKISKVRKLLEKGQSCESIMNQLRRERIDKDLLDIVRGVCGIQKEGNRHMVDILIMIATPEEEQAIVSKGDWERKQEISLHEYYMCKKKGVTFALSRGYGMGESNAAIMAQNMITFLQPRVIAMAGFCAGNSGKVRLGDVIIANKVYNYDVGKQISEKEGLPEISNYSLRGDWLQFIERMNHEWLDIISEQAPVDFDWQCMELLSSLRKTDALPVESINFDMYPNWTNVVEKLEELGYILINADDTSISLTPDGKNFIGKHLVKNPKNIAQKPKVHIGPIATGTKVQVWSDIFKWLEARHDRKTCALDMESHVVGQLGEYNKIPFIVVKGVGDFANDGKPFANRFIEFTSFASCKFIMNLFTTNEFKPYWH